jgi:hypothetical protein
MKKEERERCIRAGHPAGKQIRYYIHFITESENAIKKNLPKAVTSDSGLPKN